MSSELYYMTGFRLQDGTIMPLPASDAAGALTSDGAGNLSWLASGGNPFDQSLNTTDSVEFANVNIPYDGSLTGTDRYVNTAEANYGRKFGMYVLANGNEGGFKADSQFNLSSANGIIMHVGAPRLEIVSVSGSPLWRSSTGLIQYGSDQSHVNKFIAPITGTGDIIAQRNGTNSQKLEVYNTYTDSSNYERGVFDWQTTANTLTIGTQAGGTGTVRPVSAVGEWNFTGDVTANAFITAGNVDFTGLPTSDPTVAGRLWNDSGTLKISAG